MIVPIRFQGGEITAAIKAALTMQLSGSLESRFRVPLVSLQQWESDDHSSPSTSVSMPW